MGLSCVRDLIRMAREMVRFYCQSFARTPAQIVLDIDDTFDAVHGNQQLRLFNAYYYDEYGFQPIVVFAGDGRLVGSLLRPARRSKGAESAAHLPLDPGNPHALAEDRAPAARRQPLLPARGSGPSV